MNHHAEAPHPAATLTTSVPPAPQFAAPEIQELLRQQYGIKGDLKPLTSERDQNMRVTTETGQQFVLKIANVTEHPVFADFQIKALTHLQGSVCGVTVPKIIPTRRGEAATLIAAGAAQHIVRLVSYVPGIPFADISPDVELARSLGECLARVGVALRDLRHPGDRRALLWDMQRASGLRGLIAHVDEPDIQAAVGSCLDDFEKNALPCFKRLRTQVIHSDFNPGNVLVNAGDHSLVVGVIDFGDMVRAPLIVDVAIAASYLRSDGDNLLVLIAPFVAAYDSVVPLEPQEFELLYDLIRTRLTTTILLMRWRLLTRGDGDLYSQHTMRNERNADRFLLSLNALSTTAFADQIVGACGR